MKIYAAALLLVTHALVPGVAIAGDPGSVSQLGTLDEEPLADAGLDQHVPLGRTVLLDARGSRDPDGTIVSYEWEIHLPGGGTTTPDCPDCPRTSFRPTETGRYELVLTVVDDDGATASDTLYVDVTSGAAPTVSLSGPSSTHSGEPTTFGADARAGSTELDRLEWLVDGSVVATRDLEGAAANVSLQRTFTDTGAHAVTVRAVDEADRTATDTLPVLVVGRSDSGNAGEPDDTPSEPSDPDTPDGPSDPAGPGRSDSPGDASDSDSSNSPGDSGGTDAPGDPEESVDSGGPSGSDDSGETGGPGTRDGSDGSDRGGSPSDSVDNGTTADSEDPGGPDGSEPVDENESTLADEYEPTVLGPQVVTGTKPLSASYRLGAEPPSDALRSVDWVRDDGRFDSGRSIGLDWSPGDHRIFAILEYSDGSSDVATFTNGRTRVVADPKPSVDISDLSANGSVSGTVVAGDEYGNLVEVTVDVDGERVFERRSVRARNRPTLGSSVRSEFSYADVDPNSTHEVVVRARDGRGQTAVLRRTARSPDEIEVVRAEFVNTPVDSYHDRLDPDRYTAHHVIEVQLNGNDPSSIQSVYSNNDITKLGGDEKNKRKIINRGGADILAIHSFWAANSPKNYILSYELEGQGIKEIRGDSLFTVEPSDPELVLTTKTAGTEPRTNDWGFVVDATRSFDPDHTELDYRWTGEASAVGGTTGIGKFRSRERGALEVEDQNGGFSERRCCFLEFFVPRIGSVQKLDEGPFNATETVRFEVVSEDWAFSKVSNNYETRLSYDSGSRHVEVVEEGRLLREYDDKRSDGTEQRRHLQRAVVEVQAAALGEETPQPTVSLYNEENPERIRTNVTLPTVEVRNQTTTERFRDDVVVDSIAYEVVRDNAKKRATVTNRAELRVYRKDGYQIVERDDRTTGVVLERRIEREREQTTRVSFGSATERAEYLQANPEFRAAGSRSRTETRTRTRHVWRDERTGTGEFTGSTRTRTVPAKTQTMNQYETESRKTRTVTETVRKPVQRTIQRTVQRPVTRCNPRVGCYKTTVTKTVTETITEYRVVTKTRRITVRDRSTYWAPFPKSRGDAATGRSKEVVVEEAREITEYQFALERQQRVTVRTFFATGTRTETVSEWETYRTVESRTAARRLAKQADVRVGEVRQEDLWIVEKTGKKTEVVSEYEDRSAVEETVAFVSGVVKEKEFDPITGETEVEIVDTFRKEIRRDGVAPIHVFINMVSQDDQDCKKGSNCEN